MPCVLRRTSVKLLHFLERLKSVTWNNVEESEWMTLHIFNGLIAVITSWSIAGKQRVFNPLNFEIWLGKRVF